MRKPLLLAASLAFAMFAAAPAYAQVAEADADSSADADAGAFAGASTGPVQVTTTFESEPVPDDVTVHTTANVMAQAPQSANPCALSRVGGLSIIDFGINLGDTWIDPNCANLEQLRILDAIFNDVPEMQPVVIQMARNLFPEFDQAFVQVEQARGRRLASQQSPAAPATAEPQRTAATEQPLRGRNDQVQTASFEPTAVRRVERQDVSQ